MFSWGGGLLDRETPDSLVFVLLIRRNFCCPLLSRVLEERVELGCWFWLSFAGLLQSALLSVSVFFSVVAVV